MEAASKNNRLSFIALLFICVFITVAAFFYPKWNNTYTEATISWDVFGYYLYLPSFFYDDISKLHNFPQIMHAYHPADETGSAFLLPNGNYMMKYSMGMAMMYLPFFYIAHIWAHIAGYPADGFSFPYQVMISFGSLFVAMTGLFFARKSLLKYFDDQRTAIVLLTLVLATNYFNYVSFAGAMSHNYLFTIYSLVIWLTITWYENPSWLKSFLIGFLCGLATVTRPTEIIIVIIPFMWGMQLWKGVPERIHMLWLHRLKILLCAVAFAIPVLPQLIYWKTMSGQWLYYSYQDQGFSWRHPHLYFGMLSYKNGWLVYTPVMTLALAGFVFLFIKRRSIFWAVFFFTVANIYLVYAWDIWWYGGSFGSRAMVQSYAVLIFPLAAFFDGFRKKKMMTAFFGTAVVFCIWLNLLQTYQCHTPGLFEAENMTGAYYWRIFGKTIVQINDKKLLDTDEEMPRKYVAKLATIYEKKSPAFDSLFRVNAFSPLVMMMLGDTVQFTEKITIPVAGNENSWYRASAMVFFPQKEWDMWRMTEFQLFLLTKGTAVKSNMIRIQRVTEEGNWQQVFMDIRCKPDLHADSLKILFWNGMGTKKIFIDDLKVERAVVK